MQTTHTKNPFDFLGLDPVLLRAVYGLGYEAPTPIQKEAIPAILSGRDVIGTAQTGSGKTAAFLLPILQRLMKQSPGRTRALVLSPTRELAAQIEVALRGLAKGTRIHGHAVYGGVGMSPQEHALRAGVDVVVATPGRLLDHMSRRNVDFRGLQVLVLDEADRMLDMGFLPDVRRIVDALPRERQTLLFSATMRRRSRPSRGQSCAIRSAFRSRRPTDPRRRSATRSILSRSTSRPPCSSVSSGERTCCPSWSSSARSGARTAWPGRSAKRASTSRESTGTAVRVSERRLSQDSEVDGTRSSSRPTSRPAGSTWKASPM